MKDEVTQIVTMMLGLLKGNPEFLRLRDERGAGSIFTWEFDQHVWVLDFSSSGVPRVECWIKDKGNQILGYCSTSPHPFSGLRNVELVYDALGDFVGEFFLRLPARMVATLDPLYIAANKQL